MSSNTREYRRHDDQRQHGRGDQSADHGNRHRRAEIAVPAPADATGNMPATMATVVMTMGRARL